jgi:cysteine-rich repeat protein
MNTLFRTQRARGLALLLALGASAFPSQASAEITVQTPATALQLAQALNTNATVGAAVLRASPESAGTFSGGTSVINLPSGVLLGTGPVEAVVGPNDAIESGIDDGDDSGVTDAQLTAVFPGSSDAAILELGFECPTGASGVQLSYVFATDESHNGSADAADALAIFINGQNVARSAHLTNELVTAATLSDFRVAGIFNDNCQPDGCPVDIQADSFSTVMQARSTVLPADPGPGFSNTLKIAIADGPLDAPDPAVSSWVFLQGLTCLVDTCGNGAVDPGETCDDGNRAGGDCCSATCQAEATNLTVSPPATLSISRQAVTSAALNVTQSFAYRWDPQGRVVNFALARPASPLTLTVGSSTPLVLASLPGGTEVADFRVGITAASAPAASLTAISGERACPPEVQPFPSQLGAGANGVSYNLGAPNQPADTVKGEFFLPSELVTPFLLSSTPAAIGDFTRAINIGDNQGFQWFLLVRPFSSVPLGPGAALALGGVLVAAAAAVRIPRRKR